MSEEKFTPPEGGSQCIIGVDPASGPDETAVTIVRVDIHDTAEKTIPVEVSPFNDIAKFFGAAGTVMAHLQRQGCYYTTEASLRREIDAFFRFEKSAFR